MQTQRHVSRILTIQKYIFFYFQLVRLLLRQLAIDSCRLSASGKRLSGDVVYVVLMVCVA